MRLRREVTLGIGAILGLQLLLAMLAIAVLSRMGPAIEHILEENVYSGEAVEDMTALLALPVPQGAVPAEFDKALGRAVANVTEDDERPLLETVTRRREAAFAGDPAARREVVAALRALGQVNRDSMTRADLRAKRLSQAGAWAAALLGALSLALGILTYRRLQLRLEMPIEELLRTTQRIREGNRQARWVAQEGPHEVQQIGADLNWMMDNWLFDRAMTEASARLDEDREADIRRALAWLLDRGEVPTALVDRAGVPVATSGGWFDATHAPAPGAGRRSRQSIQDIPGTSLGFAQVEADVDPEPE